MKLIIYAAGALILTGVCIFFFTVETPDTQSSVIFGKGIEPSLSRSFSTPVINHSRSFDEIQRESDGEKRMSLFKNQLIGLDSDGHRAIFDKIYRPPYTNAQRRMIIALLVSWGRTDPKSALQATELSTGTQKAIYINYILSGWVKEDPQSAWIWATKNAQDSNLDQFVSMPRFAIMVDSLIDSSKLADAAKLVSTVVDEAIRTSIGAKLAREWTGVDPENAALWIQNIQDPGLKMIAYENYTRSICDIDSAKATTLALAQSDPKLQSSGLYVVANYLLTEQPVENTTKWIMAQTPSSSMDTAYGTYCQRIATIDPGSAIIALSRVTNDEAKNELAKSTINRLKTDLPDRAIDLTLEYVKKNPIGEASKILENWARYEPEGASKYIASNTALSETDRRQLQTVLAKALAKASAK